MARVTDKVSGVKVYGYCRISTAKQNIERQVRNIQQKYPESMIVKEVFTGKQYQGRVELEKIISTVKAGDTIVFDSVSRMSRNAAEGFELYQKLYNRGINLVFLKEPLINTETYRKELERQISLSVATGDKDTDNLMKSILAALNTYIMALARRQIELAFGQAQKEVDDLRQRTREGIETARRNGKQIGGHKEGIKMTIKKETPVKEFIKRYSKDFNGTNNDIQVRAIINASGKVSISRNTYYKYKAELKMEQ